MNISLPNPFEHEAEEYVRLARVANKGIHGKAGEVLEEKGIPDLIRGFLSHEASAFAITVTGSDAREEKGVISPLDIIVIADDRVSPDRKNAMANAIEGDLSGSAPLWLFGGNNELEAVLRRTAVFEKVEVKAMHNGPLFAFKGGTHSNAIWPARLVDAKIIHQEGGEILEEAKKRQRSQIMEGARRILDIQADRFRNYLRTTVGRPETGEDIGTNQIRGNTVVHFDIGEGQVYYNPTNLQTGFKHGPLRVVQTTLDLLTTRRIKSGKLGDEDYLRIPANIGDRLLMFQDERWVITDGRNIEDLTRLYHFFLWQYHRSEWNFLRNGEEATNFDRQLVTENLKDVGKIVQEFRK